MPKNLSPLISLMIVLLFNCISVHAEDIAGKENLIVAAHYAPWFSDDGRGWEFQQRKKVIGTVYSPLLGYYDNQDPAVLSQHIQWAREYGINTFMIEWCGVPRGDFLGSSEHVVSLFPLNSDFKNINFFFVYSFASGLRRQGEEFFSTVNFDDEEVSEKLLKDIVYAAKYYFPLPNYLRIQNKPVIYLWAVGLARGDFQKAIKKVRQTLSRQYGFELYLIADEVGWNTYPDLSRTTLFDAVMPYCMLKYEGQPPKSYSLKSSLKEVIPQYHYWSNICEDLGIDFIPGVFPGFNAQGSVHNYDNKYRPVAPVVSRSRKSFADFIKEARMLVDAEINMLYITSWSEWNEGTNIEPSEEFGFTYLKALEDSLKGKLKTKRAEDSIRFEFKRYFDPAGEDYRLLSVAFDYIAFFNSKQRLLLKIDVGTDKARKYFGFGWFENEGPWGNSKVDDFAWAGMKKKFATLHMNVPRKARFMKIRFIHPDAQRITVYLNSKQLEKFKADSPWVWSTQTIELN